MGKNKNRKRKGRGDRETSDKKAKLILTCKPNTTELVKMKESVKEIFGDQLKETIFEPPVHKNKQNLEAVNFANVDILINRSPVEELPSQEKSQNSSAAASVDKGNSQRHCLQDPAPKEEKGKERETKPHVNCSQANPQIQNSLQDSGVREDTANRHVLHCLEAVTNSDPQTMVVLSQLKFDLLLEGDVDKAAPTKSQNQTNCKGDFDILIIHRSCGLLYLEIKAVGDKFREKNPPWTEDEIVEEICKRIKGATEQLLKGKMVLQHLVSDKQTPPRIKTVLAVPNVKRMQLEKIFREHTEVKENLCECLDLGKSDDPIEYCLYADIMPAKDTPRIVTPKVAHQLTQWWRRVSAGTKPNCPNSMTDDNYTDLVARFICPNPVSFQVVKPQRYWRGGIISEIGEEFSRRVLHPDQIDVLAEGLPLRFICGPPGTGKTVVLMLMACKWLVTNPDRDLHIVSTWSGSLAASHLIAFEIRQQSPDYEGRVHLHKFNLKENGQTEAAVNTLKEAVKKDELFMICDEIFGGGEFGEFCKQLKDICKELHLWAASVYHGFCPPCLEQKVFMSPLRTPPVVTSEVNRSVLIAEKLVHEYRVHSAPQPYDGPLPTRIHHQRRGHSTSWPGDCERCGLELGETLQELIEGRKEEKTTRSDDNIPARGQATASVAASETTISSNGNTPAQTRPPQNPLCYRDVFILTTYFELEDEETDEDSHIVRPASGLLAGLKQKGIPFRVVRKGDSAALAEVVAMSGPDAVVVSDADTIRGLERKVVVWVESEMGGNASGDIDFARLDAMSRTTAQLVIVASEFPIR